MIDPSRRWPPGNDDFLSRTELWRPQGALDRPFGVSQPSPVSPDAEDVLVAFQTISISPRPTTIRSMLSRTSIRVRWPETAFRNDSAVEVDNRRNDPDRNGG
jgi:hypothetical protein